MDLEISSAEYHGLLERFHETRRLKLSTWEHVLLYAEHYRRCGSWEKVAQDLDVTKEKAALWGMLRDSPAWMIRALQEDRLTIATAPYLKYVSESFALFLLQQVEEKKITVSELRRLAGEWKKTVK